MKTKPKVFLVAQICYNADDKEFPWYIIRTGTIAEQGGYSIGRSNTSFQTIEAACNYLSDFIKSDKTVIKELVDKKLEKM
jgi:hypothetical protein